MKKLKKIVLLAVFVICANIVIAQDEDAYIKPVPPKWAVKNGFWVIETNTHTPESSIVRFYTNDQELIYTARVDGIVLNVKKRKTLVKLKRALDKVIREWEKNGTIKEQGELLAVFGN